MTQDRKDLLESEIESLKELTVVRLQELEKLKSIIEPKKEKETAPYLFTTILETKITALDLKQAEFIREVERTQNDKKIKMTDATTKLSEEWNELHREVIATESFFLLHNQKETLESRELTDIINQHSLENLYFLLIGWLLVVVVMFKVNQNNEKK